VSQPDRMVGWLLVMANDGSIKSIKKLNRRDT